MTLHKTGRSVHGQKLNIQDIANYSTGQEITCLSWNLKVHYSIHKTRSLDPVLNQLNSVHAITPPPAVSRLILIDFLLKITINFGSERVAFSK
jgi:hypothetical protein